MFPGIRMYFNPLEYQKNTNCEILVNFSFCDKEGAGSKTLFLKKSTYTITSDKENEQQISVKQTDIRKLPRVRLLKTSGSNFAFSLLSELTSANKSM